MENVADNYFKAKKKLLEHVGLITDWVECPIDDAREMYWKINKDENTIEFSPNQTFNNEDTLYQDDIYTQRFYPKHVYEGKEFTLVFCDPHVDGCQWWRIFNNSNKIT